MTSNKIPNINADNKNNKDSNNTDKDNENKNKTKKELNKYNSLTRNNTDSMKILQDANPWNPRNKFIDNALDKIARLNIKFISINHKTFSTKNKLSTKPDDKSRSLNERYLFNNEASISQNNQYHKQLIKIKTIRIVFLTQLKIS